MNRSFDAAQSLETVIELVRLASARVLEVYAEEFSVIRKTDGSPLTEADLAAHTVLTQGLEPLIAGVPVISEESFGESSEAPTANQFWLVDPLDGTKEFVRRSDEFTVNVGLVDRGAPYMGVVSAPALGTLYAGIVGDGAFRIDVRNQREAIAVNPDVSGGLTVVGSRSHGDPELMRRYLEDWKIRNVVAVGSSLKFCRIAEGLADIYPRFGRTMEWDTAAGHAILVAAGGRVETFDGQPLRYGKPGLENPHFVAASDPALRSRNRAR